MTHTVSDLMLGCTSGAIGADVKGGPRNPRVATPTDPKSPRAIFIVCGPHAIKYRRMKIIVCKNQYCVRKQLLCVKNILCAKTKIVCGIYDEHALHLSTTAAIGRCRKCVTVDNCNVTVVKYNSSLGLCQHLDRNNTMRYS